MTNVHRVADYIEHILQAIERVGRYTAEMDQAAFLASDLVQDAVLRNIEIIGEAANNILRTDAAFASRHDHIPWLIMYTMRNRVSHGYETVDMDIVWRTIKYELPELYRKIRALPPKTPGYG